jgi:hypothetical protein
MAGCKHDVDMEPTFAPEVHVHEVNRVPMMGTAIMKSMPASVAPSSCSLPPVPWVGDVVPHPGVPSGTCAPPMIRPNELQPAAVNSQSDNNLISSVVTIFN